VWNQTFEFAVQDARHLHFQIFDHDLLSASDLAGEAYINLMNDNLSDGHYHDLVIPLQPQVRRCVAGVAGCGCHVFQCALTTRRQLDRWNGDLG